MFPLLTVCVCVWWMSKGCDQYQTGNFFVSSVGKGKRKIEVPSTILCAQSPTKGMYVSW